MKSASEAQPFVPLSGESRIPREATAAAWQRLRSVASVRSVWLLLWPVAVYFAALNPFFLPATYDNIVYYFGAVSLAEEGSFLFRGQHIVDWPPGVSVLLAIPFLLGLQSVWTAKVCVVLSVAASLLLAFRLFRMEQRPYPLLTMTVFALLPTSFLMGTRIMTEWPYFLVSVLFLLALHRLREAPGPVGSTSRRNLLGWAVAAGFLLGAASLTKFTGVLLGAAVIAQAIEKWKGRGGRFQTVIPEAIAASIGAVCFLSWQWKLHWQTVAGTAHGSEYYRYGWVPETLGRFDLLSVPGKISDLFFQSETALARLGWEGWLGGAIFAVPGLIVLAGLVARCRSSTRSPADWYVASLLVLFVSIGENQQVRYLMPVAPFLIGYLFFGCVQLEAGARLFFGAVVRRSPGSSRLQVRVFPWKGTARRTGLKPETRNRIGTPLSKGRAKLRHGFGAVGEPGALAVRAATAIWILVLTGAALHLLVAGNMAGTHRGLLYSISRTPKSFYAGSWRDMYEICEYIKDDPSPGNVAVLGGGDKYVTAFTGRSWVDIRETGDFLFLVTMNGRDLSQEQAEALELRPLVESGSVVLYRKGGSRPDDRGATARASGSEALPNGRIQSLAVPERSVYYGDD